MFAFAHRFKFVAIGLLDCALSLIGPPARAEGATSSRGAQADLLEHQAEALLEAGHVAEACVKFETAETLQSAPETLVHLADCYRRAGRTASAWHTFLEAEAVARAKKDPTLAQRAARDAAALEPRLTRIVFAVPTTSRVPGLTVRLGANTVPPSSWDAPIAVDPGLQHVSAAAKGYQPWSVDIDASRGEGLQYRANVPTLAPARNQPSDANRGSAYRSAGVVTGSVGLAGIGAGAVFTALSRNPESASTCVKGVVQCTPSTSNKLLYTDAATVSFALGGTLLATGVTLFVLAPSPDKQEKNSLRVAARYASGGGRLQLEGAW